METGDKCIQEANASISRIEQPDVLYCQSTWDNFLCWPETAAGDSFTQKCPDSLSSYTDTADANATKQCFSNGSWDKTDYLMCFPGAVTVNHSAGNTLEYGMKLIYIIGYSFTIAALVIALGIFAYFRSLRCLRNLIHCNLICAFLLKSIIWLILQSTAEKLNDSHETICILLVIVAHHFVQVPFYWMFVEGMYLFTIVVWAFSATKIKLWPCITFGWGVPVIPSTIWMFLKTHTFSRGCLHINHEKDNDFILHGPVIVMLLGNIFFIAAIIWVLVTKLRDSNTLVTNQSKKAAKAIVVLVPLLGVSYMFFMISPRASNNLVWTLKYVNAFLLSFQGLFVAIIYCFLNGEVQSVVLQKLRSLQDSRSLSGRPRRDSCSALATTSFCNNGVAIVPGGNTTSPLYAQRLSVTEGDSKFVSRDETTMLLAQGSGPSFSSNAGNGKTSKMPQTCDIEMEANDSTMGIAL
ncbi:corticotropin-releasing factor receptor 1-like [Plakobranchus ocellatus]|uniref:Corticotropin-releasing factor receptor 1-like n=1 Tax=Plakobranchus ocellatus TaxID=259542 RepID=A0AAV4AIY5_9GAST|nr:corticotropin-releasing factor receptor 1-like [Plakobranchus ocellatus]